MTNRERLEDTGLEDWRHAAMTLRTPGPPEALFGQSLEANWLFLQSLLDVYRIENVTQVSLMP